MTTIVAQPRDLLAMTGTDLGVTDWLTIDQARINLFADATGDHQWIHVDPERAATGPFGTTIAHGYLTLSLVNIFLPQLLEVRRFAAGINIGADGLRFLSPVPAGARIRGKGEIVNAISNSWIDNGSLRTYRHAPNTGPRKSWAAGDACRRAVTHALDAVKGEVGYPSALTTKTWGFYDVAFKGKAFEFERPFGSYVMENVLFKISYPAEFHAQTAVECAMRLHREVADRIDQIDKVVIETQEAGARIIDKTGPLANYADRDHCIQYMVAVPLIFGRLTADDYSDATAADRRIDALRDCMVVVENPQFTQDYFDPDKRYIGNSVHVFFKDGSATAKVSIDYPIGHRKRRAEGIPLLLSKFESALAAHLPAEQVRQIIDASHNRETFDAMPIHRLMDWLAVD